MHLILLRHADKEFSGPDPALSARGLAQAQALVALLAKDDRWPSPVHIFASPKRRAQQTAQPLADALNLKLKVLDDLDEHRPHESNAGFRQRLRRMISDIESDQSTCVVWCTHLDWIEEFRALADCESDLLDSPFDVWGPAQFLILRLDDLWHVVKFGRAP